MSESAKNKPPVSDETRRRLGLAAKGKKYSESHRKAISEGLKGKNNPMYGRKGKDNPNTGRKATEENKRNMREAAKNRPPHSEEHKRKIRGKAIGRTKTEDTKRKISETMKGDKHHYYGKHFSAEHKRKLSESLKGKLAGENNPNYGKKASLETRRKMSECRRLEKNPRWLGGKSFEPYGLEFNEELKRSIRERDNYTCQYMGEPAKDCHHIDYDKTHNTPDNLITLCRKCHTMANSNRTYWKRLFTNMTKTNLKFN